MTDQAKSNLEASLDRKQGTLGANLLCRLGLPGCVYDEAASINTRRSEA